MPSAANNPHHRLSRFLPPDFDPTRPVAVIAGRGAYPELTCDALHQAGLTVRLIAFEGETREALVERFDAQEQRMIKVGQLGHMLKALRQLDAAACIMAGQIRPGRLFRGLHPDLKAIRILSSLKERNAATIFGAVAREIEAIGVHQLDARAFLDDHLATPGLMSGRKFDWTDSLVHGLRIARAVAELDIGQGVVVSRGTVLAVEAFEGTDAMLRRAGELGGKEPLFVKTVKPGQDYRFDVPVFGTTTLDVMHEAGLRHAALEAHRTLMLDKSAVLKQAREQGITLWGYEAESSRSS